MKKVKSVLITSLILAVTFALVFLLYVGGKIFWAFALMSVCVFAACPLYYEKTEDHPVVLMLFAAPLMLLYSFAAMLIRYAVVGGVTTELVVAVVTAILLYGLLFLALYLILYLIISWFLKTMNF